VLPKIDHKRFFENSIAHTYSLEIFSNLTFSEDFASIKSIILNNTQSKYKDFYENPLSIYDDKNVLAEVQEYLRFTSHPTETIKIVLIDEKQKILAHLRSNGDITKY